jgi:hypothetical protein
MIIDCPHCESKVDAKIEAELDHPVGDDLFRSKSYFLKCPACFSPMVGDAASSAVG